jgi:protein ImuB
MSKRFLCIWFRYLKTDWFSCRQPELRSSAFVLVTPDHGRMIISAANSIAVDHGLFTGMVLADAKAIIPGLQYKDDDPLLSQKLLKAIAEWSVRFTPSVAIHGQSDLILDITGCAHLWGGETNYLQHIESRFAKLGYLTRATIADTIGAAWAIAHFGISENIILPGQQSMALQSLSPAALRLDDDTVDCLYKLGLRKIGAFFSMPRSALRRRFGDSFLKKLDQATGKEEEFLETIHAVEPWLERLYCLEPLITATAIGIAIKKLLDAVCGKLMKEGKGLRLALIKCYRIDNKCQQLEIPTNYPTANAAHLFKLFELKIETIEPGPGIELFTLGAKKIEETKALQEKLWTKKAGLTDRHIWELIDRFHCRFGAQLIHRYLPAEHYWPERSYKKAASLDESIRIEWKNDKPRPLQLLARPEPIQVTAPVPDYPPMLFRYKGQLHKIVKADGPERIEQEWWLQQGQHRDYYYVEDEQGVRFWVFRSGHFSDPPYQWFIHGFFA